LDYDEHGNIIFGQEDIYSLSTHSYHFNARINGFHPFRVDLDGKNLHANHYDRSKVKYNPSWPDHLVYPTHIDLNIEDFNLALALNTSLIYISTKKYPLERTNASLYNVPNDRLRRQLG
jgi:hypothetical protein